MPDFEKIPPYQKRNFVPENINLKDAGAAVKQYRRLLEREIDSAAELERWLCDFSELDAALNQTASILYIQMTCQTDDQARAKAYQKFIETVTPAVEPWENKLLQRYLKLSQEYPLDRHRYEVYDREVKEEIQLFCEANIPLHTKVKLLCQEYQAICGKMTVEFRGKERTLPEMAQFLEEPDRPLREEAWRAVSRRRLEDKDRFEELFDRMLEERNTIASNAGMNNFVEYQFRAYHRFDYTPEDCRKYHAAIEKVVVPVWKKIFEKRRKRMKLDKLRPWDLAVDPLGRPPLRPFKSADELIAGVEKIMQKVDPDLGSQFAGMAKAGLLDLDSRKGKAPGGYQNSLAEARQPFIFMNAVGVDYDVFTLMHESGHAFHSLACQHEPIHSYRHAPMEFSEVSSMGMELLGAEHIGVFYPQKEDAERSREGHFENTIQSLVWSANIDAFQHWIYENPRHTVEERTRAWLEIHERFGGSIADWTGLEEAHRRLWHRQLHIFEVPFYYIEYGIAQLGALQVWLNAKKDWAKGVAQYRKAQALGGSRPLAELFEAAGTRFDFTEKTMAPLVAAVARELSL